METLHVPDTVPVMTLPNTVFFPQALLPLHIFEPRYRQMLRDVLARDRLFAVAQLLPTGVGALGAFEPAAPVATVGIVRACQQAENDTSNLLLQGIVRVAIEGIAREAPYRVIRIRPLASTSGGTVAQLELERLEVMRLLNVRRRLGNPTPKGMTRFLESIDDIDTFADVAVFNLCDDGAFKQTLLEELNTLRRLRLFAHRLKAEIEEHKLRRKLQGGLTDEQIADN